MRRVASRFRPLALSVNATVFHEAGLLGQGSLMGPTPYCSNPHKIISPS